jgi:hypothetical protein
LQGSSIDQVDPLLQRCAVVVIPKRIQLRQLPLDICQAVDGY